MRNLVVALVLLSATSIARAEPFFARLSLQGVTFQVESPNEGSINPVTVLAEIPGGKPGPVQVEADGTVTGAEIGDLNGDGHPEIYVYVNSAGSGSYGSLVAFAASSNGSLRAIGLPPLADDPGAARGYMGHDRFAVGEDSLVRRFPVYRHGDTNVAPSGGTRQIRYRLEAIEASWRLVTCEVINVQDAGNSQ